MKKSLFLLAAVALFASCAQKDVKNDVIEDEIPIGFVPAYMEKVTRANSGEMAITPTNTFNVDGNTFEVWGWKTNTQGTSKVFDNQVVTYSSSNTTTTTKWGYTPIKYWDRKASYLFYAVAPDGKFTMNEDNTTAANRKVSAANVPSVQILADNNGTSKVTAPNPDAKDYLVAAVVECADGDHQGNAGDKDVAFTFSHILTKLTVKAKTISDFDNTGTAMPQLKLTKLKISLNGMAQNYAQKTAGTVDAGATDKDAWTNAISSAIEKVCFNADGSTVTALPLNSTTAQEVASYFVAPTTTGTTGDNATAAGTATVKVTAEYDITYSDGVTDHCETPETTVTNLTSFVQNTHNILTVTISPTAILFDVQTVNDFTPENEINQDVD